MTNEITIYKITSEANFNSEFHTSTELASTTNLEKALEIVRTMSTEPVVNNEDGSFSIGHPSDTSAHRFDIRPILISF